MPFRLICNRFQSRNYDLIRTNMIYLISRKKRSCYICIVNIFKTLFYRKSSLKVEAKTMFNKEATDTLVSKFSEYSILELH